MSVLLPPLAVGLPGAHARSMAAGIDTVVTRVIAQRDVLDWATGLLAVLALTLLVVLLAGLVVLVFAVRRSMRDVSSTLHRLTEEATPLIAEAQGTMTALHGMVRQVRSDVERLSGAAGQVGDQVREATDAAAGRLEALGDTLDRLQEELEATVDAASAALRGLRLTLLGLLMGERSPRGARSRSGRARRHRTGPMPTDATPAHATEDETLAP